MGVECPVKIQSILRFTAKYVFLKGSDLRDLILDYTTLLFERAIRYLWAGEVHKMQLQATNRKRWLCLPNDTS